MFTIVKHYGRYAGIEFQEHLSSSGNGTFFRNEDAAQAEMQYMSTDMQRQCKVVELNEIFFVNEYKKQAFFDGLEAAGVLIERGQSNFNGIREVMDRLIQQTNRTRDIAAGNLIIPEIPSPAPYTWTVTPPTIEDNVFFREAEVDEDDIDDLYPENPF